LLGIISALSGTIIIAKYWAMAYPVAGEAPLYCGQYGQSRTTFNSGTAKHMFGRTTFEGILCFSIFVAVPLSVVNTV